MHQIFNLTPHDVTVLNANGEVAFTCPGTQKPARVVERAVLVEPLEIGHCQLPRYEVSYDTIVDNLPEPEDGVIIVVSQLVCQALPHRTDLYYPYDVIRDENNVIVGCRGLAQMV